MNRYFCDLQNELVKEFKLGDRVEIVCSDMLEQGKLLAKADVVLMHNVFEFFHKTEGHSKHWKFLMSTLKAGALLVTSPSLEQQFESGKVGLDLDKWVKKSLVRIPKARYTEEEMEDLRELHLYQVAKPC